MRTKREKTYSDAQLKVIVCLLDALFLEGKRTDLATVISYAAHRIEDMDSRLAEQIASGIAEEALAISVIPGGD